MNRDEMATELLLRENIRRSIKAVKAKRLTEERERLLAENMLRKLIRNILSEKAAVPDEIDQTGRNIAFSSFKKIEQNILDSYELLDNEKDAKIFYDYLLTNVKLYFDKFEDELSGSVPDVTTPEYEQAKEEPSQDTEL